MSWPSSRRSSGSGRFRIRAEIARRAAVPRAEKTSLSHLFWAVVEILRDGAGPGRLRS